MPRLVDPQLEKIGSLVRAMARAADNLLNDALITLKLPGCDFGRDAEYRDEEINRLDKELQEAIALTIARFQPTAGDNRYLLAVMATSTDLEHLGDCAKHICRVASEISHAFPSLQRLLQLTQSTAVDCFRALHQLEVAEPGLARTLPVDSRELTTRIVGRRREVEDAMEVVIFELGEVDGGRLSSRELEYQILAAQDLRRICDYMASIADQQIFYTSGVHSSSAARG